MYAICIRYIINSVHWPNRKRHMPLCLPTCQCTLLYNENEQVMYTNARSHRITNKRQRTRSMRGRVKEQKETSFKMLLFALTCDCRCLFLICDIARPSMPHNISLCESIVQTNHYTVLLLAYLSKYATHFTILFNFIISM